MKVVPEKLRTQSSNLTYDPYSKADIAQAEIHRLSHLIGRVSPENSSKCLCCNFPLKSELFPLNCNLIELSDLGPGFALYFIICKLIGFILVLGLLLVGIPCIIDNSISESSEDWNHNDDSWEVVSTLGNKGNSAEIYPTWQCALHIGYMALVLIFYHISLKWLSKKEKEFDVNTISPRDYTVHAYGLGDKVTESEVKSFFEQKGRFDGKKAKVEKVVFVYKIKEYIDEFRKLIKLTEELHKSENLKSKTCNRLRKKNEIKQDIELVSINLCKIEESVSLNGLTGQAFVTFNTQADARAVEAKFSESFVLRFWKKLFSYVFYCRFRRKCGKIEESRVYAELANEPNDIYWENLEVSFIARFCKLLSTSLSTSLAVLMTFVVVYGMKIYERGHDFDDKGKSNKIERFNTRIASVWPSVVIIIINFILSVSTRYSVSLERAHSVTHYNISLSFKLVFMMFFNTAIITLFINYDWKNDWFVPGGLVIDSLYILFSNAFITPFIYFFSPAVLIHWIHKQKVKKASYVSQHEANILFENPSVDIAQRYASLIKTLLLTFCYAPIVPLAFGISALGVLVEYWNFKYLLLRRHSIPHQLSGELAKYVYAAVPWAILFYSIINFVFSFHLNLVERRISLCWMCFLFVYNFVPFHALMRFRKKIYLSEWEAEEKYENVSFNFIQDYDKLNPMTSGQALMSFADKMRKSGLVAQREFNLIEEEIKNDLPNSLAGLRRYATLRSNFGEFEPKDFKLLARFRGFDLNFKSNNVEKIYPVLSILKSQISRNIHGIDNQKMKRRGRWSICGIDSAGFHEVLTTQIKDANHESQKVANNEIDKPGSDIENKIDQLFMKKV